MFYDILKAKEECINNPMLIFEAIRLNYREVYESVIESENFNINIINSDSDSLLMKLVRNKDYDLVSKYISREDLVINYQNNDGDTLAHLLMANNYVEVKEIFEKLLKRVDFLPNIKNNYNETILDKSINNQYLYPTIKILSDKRFNNITLYSFKNLYETYIKSNNYGKYSKLSNYVLIFDNLKKKKLIPTMSKLMHILKKEEATIKNDFELSRTSNLDMIINHLIKETI